MLFTDQGDGDDRGEQLRTTLASLQDRITNACRAAGRDRAEVTLIAVTKFFPADDVIRLSRIGVRDIGENRHQEAQAKVAELNPQTRSQLTVHFIGQLQSNKAAAVAAYADVIQSLDRPKLIGTLERAAAERSRSLQVLLQVDLAGDDRGRGGAWPADLDRLADEVAATEHLQLRGLMAVAPLGADPRLAFAQLHDLSARLRTRHPQASWISAGMSGDLEAAIQAGATHLRVGSAILGSRPPLR